MFRRILLALSVPLFPLATVTAASAPGASVGSPRGVTAATVQQPTLRLGSHGSRRRVVRPRPARSRRGAWREVALGGSDRRQLGRAHRLLPPGAKAPGSAAREPDQEGQVRTALTTGLPAQAFPPSGGHSREA